LIEDSRETRFGARITNIATAAGLSVPPNSVAAIAAHLRQHLEPDSASSAIARYLRDLKRNRPHLFVVPAEQAEPE
jgi:hypothetical protein